MTPSLDELRAQCRIDEDDDEALLTIYAEAARDLAQEYLNLPLFDTEVPEDVDEGVIIEGKVKLAIMLAVGHWYENRESSSETQLHEVPMGFYHLLKGKRKSPGT
ncbi:head-tail connector protein [Serratia sp. L9]|uniref:head-tail connector protein n=1 Tax=Serratia sp. L9 TaxID=3423946 RepID=UPI003D667A63